MLPEIKILIDWLIIPQTDRVSMSILFWSKGTSTLMTLKIVASYPAPGMGRSWPLKLPLVEWPRCKIWLLYVTLCQCMQGVPKICRRWCRPLYVVGRSPPQNMPLPAIGYVVEFCDCICISNGVAVHRRTPKMLSAGPWLLVRGMVDPPKHASISTTSVTVPNFLSLDEKVLLYVGRLTE